MWRSLAESPAKADLARYKPQIFADKRTTEEAVQIETRREPAPTKPKVQPKETSVLIKMQAE